MFVENHGLLSGIDIVPIIQLLKLEYKYKWAEFILLLFKCVFFTFNSALYDYFSRI